MELIDAEQAGELYGRWARRSRSRAARRPTPSAGVAVVRRHGRRSSARSRDDQLGAVFAHDIRAVGVEFVVAPGRPTAPPTARCLILVTPDAQRTMNTYLGASAQLGPADIDPTLVAAAAGHLPRGLPLGPSPMPRTPSARRRATAHEAGGRVAFTLSDSFCVDRHRAEFLELVDADVDVLFANEAEICSLYEVDDVRRRRCSRSAARLRASRRSPAARAARWSCAERRGARRSRPHPSSDGRRHHRRRRPVRRRLPLRPHPRATTSPTAPGSAAWPRRRSSPTSAPAPRWPSPTSSRSTCGSCWPSPTAGGGVTDDPLTPRIIVVIIPQMARADRCLPATPRSTPWATACWPPRPRCSPSGATTGPASPRSPAGPASPPAPSTAASPARPTCSSRPSTPHTSDELDELFAEHALRGPASRTSSAPSAPTSSTATRRRRRRRCCSRRSSPPAATPRSPTCCATG